MDGAALIEITIDVIEEAKGALVDFLADISPAGVVEGWEWEGEKGPVVVYLPYGGADAKLHAIQRYLKSLVELWGEGAVLRYEVHDLVGAQWRTEYQRFFRAQRITDRITVAPPWEEYGGSEDEIVIRILPGPAFGTGSHETTRLCLTAIEETCATGRVTSLLDVGCGSGILAIAGALLGIAYVVGVESDVDAVKSARENVARNHLEDRVTVREGLFDCPVGTFDLVVANLTTTEIEGVIVPLLGSRSAGGSLVLSGILDTEEDRMREIIHEHVPIGPHEISVRRRGEWLCFVIGDKDLDKSPE